MQVDTVVFTDRKYEQHLNFWKSQQEGFSENFQFRQRIAHADGLTLKKGRQFKLQRGQMEAIHQMVKGNDTGIFLGLLSSVAILLKKYSAADQLIINTPLLNPEGNSEGYVVNKVPLLLQIEETDTLRDCLKNVQKSIRNCYRYQGYPTSLIKTQQEEDLFQTNVLIQYQPLHPVFDITAATEDLLIIITRAGDDFFVQFYYRNNCFSEDFIALLYSHFTNCLSGFAELETPLNKLKLIGEEEKKQILAASRNSDIDYPEDKTILDLIEAQVLLHPDKIAVSCEGQSLSYQELHEQSNQVAHYLCKKGVKVESLVAVCIDRSLDMIVALLGVLKAGGAYVPIDSDYPKDRVHYILSDCEASVMITSQQHRHRFEKLEGLEVVAMDGDRELLSKEDTQSPKVDIQADNLAYIIYTSGTTGNPKGVMLEHKNVVRLLVNAAPIYDFNADDVWTMFHTFCFDFSVWEMYGPLFFGGSLVIVPKKVTKDMAAFEELIIREGVTVLNQTPTAFYVLQDRIALSYPALKVRYVIFGGEALKPAQLERWFTHYPDCKLINMYGITETTVHNTFKEIGEDEIQSGLGNIGMPIPTIDCYILNGNQQLLPIGVAGELNISGPGVARGYLNRPELTAAKFVVNPYDTKWSRLYRSGDLVRRLPNGEMEYLGRMDGQIKIRGYRIELGEVESTMRKESTVDKCVVLGIGDESDGKRLVAFIIPKGDFSKEKVRDFLGARLPSYMVPAIMVNLEKFPMTSNGKVDKKALLQIDLSIAGTASQYVAPRNEIETQIADIWCQLLKVERIGAYDNFFEMGGDSIITIQVVNRARRHGLQLSPDDLFEYQTVAALAAFAATNKAKTISSEQDQLSGAATLLPIQRWFLEKEDSPSNHFNHALLFELDKNITHRILEQSIQAILAHHDALRFAYFKEGKEWKQKYSDFRGTLDITDLTETPIETLQTTISDVCQVYQKSLNIERGILARFAFMKTPEAEQNNRLFLVVHHLAIDGVSWRILLDDIETALEARVNNKSVELGFKGSSYREWGAALEQYAATPRITTQQAYWNAVFEGYQPLPVDHQAADSHVKDVTAYTIKLNQPLTTALLQEVSHAYHTKIDDILLSSLAQTLCHWSQQNKIIIGMEGHGRESLFSKVDISNTIGWFTNLYPLALNVEKDMPTGNLIKSIKEQLRAIPEKGMGYGLLRYLHPSQEVRASLSEGKWEIVFNYLGQLDQLVNNDGRLLKAKEAIGDSSSPTLPFTNKLEINSAITGGQLMLSWSYSEKQYKKETIQQVAEAYIANLQQLITHCKAKKDTDSTPADYGLADAVSYKELDDFLNTPEKGGLRKDQISAVYPLSPLQEGLLFHGLYDVNSPVYNEQMSFDLPQGVDLAAFKASFQYLLQNHSILRSSVFYDALNIPVQCVYKDVIVPFEELDFSGLSAEEQDVQFEQLKLDDAKRGFDFTQAPLMRVTMVKLNEQSKKMIWTHHHILLDGWSMPILMGELLIAYEAYSKGETPTAKKEEHYEDFIKHITAQDKYQEESFWKDYLKGFDSPTLLPFVASNQERNKGADSLGKNRLTFDDDVTEKIKRYAQSAHITVNTLVQGVWALLVSKYAGGKEALYGVTVSGRPSDLEAAEERIGLYINTLPLRTTYEEDQLIDEWLVTLQKGHTAAREYQNTALNKIKKWTNTSGDFFDSILIFENYPMGDVMAKKWALEIDNLKMEEQTNFLLSIIAGLGKKLNVSFEYNESLLSTEYVEMLKAHFQQAMLQIVESEAKTIGEIALDTAAEQADLITYSDNTAVTYPKDQTIVSLFEKQVKMHADRSAITFEGSSLSYRELNERANQLAHYLRKAGVKNDDLVAICIDRSVEMIIGVLGILKAGAAYVPIDPDYPQERINFILKDSNATIAITNKACSTFLSEHSNVLALDRDQALLIKESSENLNIELQPNNLAYVIYTSGTTGQPKGVLLEHQNVVRLFFTDQALFDFGPKDVWTLFHSFCFDFSVWEMYGALLFGGKLVVVSKETARDTNAFKTLLQKEGVTILNQTPSAFYLLQEQMAASPEPLDLRYIIFGGEALNPAQLTFWHSQYPDCQLINMYGITETTVHVTYKKMTEKEIGSSVSNIGKPIPTLSCFVLDSDQKLLPQGVAGELYVGGAGLARGYLNREELTKQRFVQSTVGGQEMRLYKTGDLARWLPTGQLEYLGRIDDQVKIRGYRIELGEIEATLQQSPLVGQCAVIAREDAAGSKRLQAYVVPQGTFDQSAILDHLNAQLPAYMVPAFIIELEELPLTANGKLDRKALPQPDAKQSSNEIYVAARNETEESITAIWSDVLAVGDIGVKDNFFNVGGDSILLIRVISRLQKIFDKNIKVVDFYQHATIEELARYFTTDTTSNNTQEREAAIQQQLDDLKQNILSQHSDAANIEDAYPMSDIQKGMVFASLMNPELGLYHDQFAYQIPFIKPALFQKALSLIVEKHATFRTAFNLNDYQQEVQLIYKTVLVNIDYEDLRTVEAVQQQAHIQQFMEEERKRPFVTTEAGLWRSTIFRISDEEMVYVFQFHHALLDGWSVASLNTELYTLCKRLLDEPTYQPTPLKADYKTGVIEHLLEKSDAANIEFWQKELADYKRLDVFTEEDAFQKHLLPLDTDLMNRLTELAQAEGITLKTLFFGACLYTLKQLTYDNDLTIGMVSNIRPACEDGDKILGCFLNTLPFRSQVPVDGKTTWSSYLKDLEEQFRAIKQRDRITLYDLTSITKEHAGASNPFFDVLFNFIDFHIYDNLKVEESTEQSTQQLDITSFESTNTFLDISVSVTGGRLMLSLSARKALKSGLPITTIGNFFKRSLQHIANKPKALLHEAEVLSKETRQQLLVDFNQTATTYPADKTVVELFEEQAARTPDRIALAFEGTKISYRELDEQSNQLANYLIAKGITTESLVALGMYRSIELIISILGVMKAGGAYVPINPTLPKERIDYMLKDAAASILITNELFAEELANIRKESTAAVKTTLTPDNLMYVIYTSGTTGVPKGVLVTHRNVSSLVKGVGYVHFDESDVLLSTGAPSFDAVTFEYWGMLLNGGQLVLCPETHLLDTKLLKSTIAQHQCSKMWFTAGWFNELVDTDISIFSPLKTILVGGEKLSFPHIAKLRSAYKEIAIINGYGPTENTTFSLTYEIGQEVNADIPIGKPLNNRQAYILDQTLQPVAMGVIGELWVGGDGIARSYLNDPELSAERFIANPFLAKSRLYRTGDLACWIADESERGNIAFMGRVDDQVKIRGFRIELGEIEAVLEQAPAVKQSVLIAKADAQGSKRLVAYIVAEESYDRNAVQQYLQSHLPAYMVPSLIMQLEVMPLTANGKVDKKALPEPDTSALQSNEYVAPQNEIEEQLALIWQELLDVERVGIYDNFFELGGHSLLATRMASSIQKEFEMTIPIKVLFEYTCIADLAKYIKLASMEQEQDDDAEEFDL